MDKVILCYSFSGTSLHFAKKLQSANGAHLIEVKEAHNRSRASAFSKGVFQARRHEMVELSDDIPDLSAYASVTMVFPIWAGCPAPAFNTAVAALPKEADVTVYLVSASGKSNDNARDVIREQIGLAGCKLNKINDISSKSAKK